MTATTITAGDANSGLIQSAGNDGTLVLQTGPAGGKVSAVSLDASGNAAILGSMTQGGIATPRMVVATAQTTTSGTTVDFTSIPSWVKKISILMDSVSTSGTSNLVLQLGAGSVETSGYSSTVVGLFNSSTVTASGPTLGFGVGVSGGASDIYTGIITLAKLSGNLWVCSGSLQKTVGNVITTAGSKTLGGTLDRIRLTATNGSDTFDGGSVNILYEG